MSNGAILANSGHFDAELDLNALREMSGGRVRNLRRDVQEYDLGDRKVYVLAEGRLVNLAAAEGHPAAVMDMSFANQALAAEYGAKHHAELKPDLYTMPADIDREVARLKLEALGIEIDTMTPEQLKYVNSWQEGT
jgi:adenosylhomocysteinase